MCSKKRNLDDFRVLINSTVEGAEEGMGYMERGVEVQWTEQIDAQTCTGRRDSPAFQSITV